MAVPFSLLIKKIYIEKPLDLSDEKLSEQINSISTEIYGFDYFIV